MSTRETVKAFFYANPLGTYGQAAELAGVSKQRAKQIVDTEQELREFLKDFRQQRRSEAYAKLAAIRIKRYGTDLTPEEFHKDQEQSYKYRRWQLKRADASRKKIAFDVGFADIDWPDYCPALGIKLDYTGEDRTENSCSFDRLDPSKGYVKGNVYVISWRANRIKNNGTSAEHRGIAEYMDNAYSNFLDKEGLSVL